MTSSYLYQVRVWSFIIPQWVWSCVSLSGCDHFILFSDELLSATIVSPDTIFTARPTNFYANVTTKYNTTVSYTVVIVIVVVVVIVVVFLSQDYF